MVKERPILFSGPMVRAILDGRKTQTRRVVKPHPLNGPFEVRHYHPERVDYRGNLYPGPSTFGICDVDGEWSIKCPYGAPGDRLWVRETWLPFDEDHRIADVLYAYRADTPSEGEEYRKSYVAAGRNYHWRPSIHMPRWASRITLEITGVRVERLNEISEEDAKAEGCNPAERVCDSCGWIGTWNELGDVQAGDDEDCHRCPKCGDDTDGWYLNEQFRKGFRGLWESLNGAGSWAANPWVWVIEFRKV